MFTLTIQTDNAAFDDAPEWEIARILREAADRIESGRDDNRAPIVDVNGNTVGEWRIT